MNDLFVILEKLASLIAPSVLALQSLLHVSLVEVPNANGAFRFYEGQSALGSVGKIDFRLPRDKAATAGPFLVLSLRNSTLTWMDIEKQFGPVRMDDPSHHHPHFVGYSFTVAGRRFGLDADATTHRVDAISIDFSEAPGRHHGPH